MTIEARLDRLETRLRRLTLMVLELVDLAAAQEDALERLEHREEKEVPPCEI